MSPASKQRNTALDVPSGGAAAKRPTPTLAHTLAAPPDQGRRVAREVFAWVSAVRYEQRDETG
jgi:hypothetical protein